MNIDSKLYNIRSTGFGGIEILHKPSGRLAYAEAAEFPSAERLAIMSESAFNRTCKESHNAR